MKKNLRKKRKKKRRSKAPAFRSEQLFSISTLPVPRQGVLFLLRNNKKQGLYQNGKALAGV